MKERLLLFLIFAVLFSSIGALFVYGEKIIRSFSEGESSVIYFSNDTRVINSTDVSALDIEIQNFEQEAGLYQVEYFAKEEPVLKIDKKLEIGEQEKITAPDKFIDFLKDNFLESETKIKIVIQRNDSKMFISKYVFFKKE